jgi:hypothetical protein
MTYNLDVYIYTIFFADYLETRNCHFKKFKKNSKGEFSIVYALSEKKGKLSLLDEAFRASRNGICV